MTHMYFSARAEGRILYGHLGRTNLFGLTVVTYEYSPHPRTFLLLKLPPIFSCPRPITFSPGAAVADGAGVLWVGL